MNSILLRSSLINEQEYPGIDSWQYSEAKNNKSYQTGGSGNRRIGLLCPGRFSTAGRRWRASGLSLWLPCCHQLKKNSGESRMSLKPVTWCMSLLITRETKKVIIFKLFNLKYNRLTNLYFGFNFTKFIIYHFF